MDLEKRLKRTTYGIYGVLGFGMLWMIVSMILGAGSFIDLVVTIPCIVIGCYLMNKRSEMIAILEHQKNKGNAKGKKKGKK